MHGQQNIKKLKKKNLSYAFMLCCLIKEMYNFVYVFSFLRLHELLKQTVLCSSAFKQNWIQAKRKLWSPLRVFS